MAMNHYSEGGVKYKFERPIVLKKLNYEGFKKKKIIITPFPAMNNIYRHYVSPNRLLKHRVDLHRL